MQYVSGAEGREGQCSKLSTQRVTHMAMKRCAIGLIEAGADVNAPADGRIPLQMAANGKSYDLLKTLVDAGADVNNRQLVMVLQHC